MIDNEHTSKKRSSSVKYSPRSKRAKCALDFTVLPESSSPMSEPTTSKRATNPKDEDYSALKHTKFMFCLKLHQWRQVGLAVVMGPCMNY